MGETVFMTLLGPDTGLSTRAMIDSIRTFGGALSDSRILVFTRNMKANTLDWADKHVQIIPLDVPASVREYPFGAKVYASAQAEAVLGPRVGSLVYIDPVCVVANPPLLFDLGDAFDAAVRPVHIRNVGLQATDPLDNFWSKIYATVGATDILSTVESFVDEQCIRAYFNSHTFAINPAKGLLRRWFDDFEALVADRDWQGRACSDPEHQTFLFQAIFSALLVTALEPNRIRILPPTYNYPYHLHQRTRVERRARSLSDLVCFAYEESSIDPRTIDDIEIGEPLKAWLEDRFSH